MFHRIINALRRGPGREPAPAMKSGEAQAEQPAPDEAPDTARLEEALNKTYPGLALYVRDVDLPEALAAQYVEGLILRERAFVDASNKAGGLRTTHRYAILSNHMRDMSPFELETDYGLHVANRDSRFKVLGQYRHEDKTLILLLHLPDDDSWKLLRHVSVNMDEEVVKTVVERFIRHCGEAPVPELEDPEWRDRCAFPLGMDAEGRLTEV